MGEQSGSWIDFELRRAARRRVLDTLEGHQKREAEVAKTVGLSLLVFYESSLKAIGVWLESCVGDAAREAELKHLAPEAGAQWLQAVSDKKASSERLKAMEGVEAAAKETYELATPDWKERMFPSTSNRPEVSVAKKQLDLARSAAQDARVEDFDLEEILKAVTKRTLSEVTASAERATEALSFAESLRSAAQGCIEELNVVWASHATTEKEELRNVLEMVHLLAGTAGVKHEPES